MNRRDAQKYDPSVENKFEDRVVEVPSFEWAGYHWQSCMEGGRLIHPDYPYQWYDIEQLRIVSDLSNTKGLNPVDIRKLPMGALANTLIELHQQYKATTIHYWDGNTYNPILACGTMRSVEDFGFGVFSCKIKCPHGHNLWPSFWLSGAHNWPPEIDIMEAWSYEDNYFKWFIPQFPYLSPGWKTTTNVHYLNDSMEHNSVGSRNVSWFKSCKNPADEFKEYKIEWLQDRISFYVDDRLVREVKGDVCRMLTKNLTHPDEGYRMKVIFNVWAEDPKEYNVSMSSPMIIKNFKYDAK